MSEYDVMRFAGHSSDFEPDLDVDTNVDFIDFAFMATHWLEDNTE